MVAKNITKINEKSLDTNPALSGSIGFGLPFAVLHLLIRSIFHDAPIILPYAIIAGAINVNIAAASQTGVNVPSD